jgi:hypothetical protein
MPLNEVPVRRPPFASVPSDSMTRVLVNPWQFSTGVSICAFANMLPVSLAN